MSGGKSCQVCGVKLEPYITMQGAGQIAFKPCDNCKRLAQKERRKAQAKMEKIWAPPRPRFENE